MQKVKFYTVQEQEVIAHDRVRYHKYSMSPNLVHCEDKVLECVETVDVPVIHICTPSSPGYKHHYLAIAPELLELLRVAVDMEISKKYTSKLIDLKQRLDTQTDQRWELESRIAYFNSLPWYKRLFKRP